MSCRENLRVENGLLFKSDRLVVPLGQQYLLVTDSYSKYFEIELLRQSTASCVINKLKKIFARFEIPEKVVSGNGSQYSNTRNVFGDSHNFKKFAKEWGFQHTTSSPEYPQSNRAAERAVKTAKRIFRRFALKVCSNITIPHLKILDPLLVNFDGMTNSDHDTNPQTFIAPSDCRIC